MMYAAEIGSGGMIHAQTFMKIGIGIQTIFKFCLSNLKVCGVGLRRCNEFGLHKVHDKFHDDRFRYLSIIMVITATV
jgi:hypothetical protein